MQNRFPLISQMSSKEEVLWCNPDLLPFETASQSIPLTPDDVASAEARLRRFAPCIQRLFPETALDGGRIESPLVEAEDLAHALVRLWGRPLPGRLMLKCDSHLPVSGSIKARGGIYEVLKHAESLALSAGLIRPEDDYGAFADPEFRSFFGRHAIAVGSTGNLGLSIGIMGAALGFRVHVHMSADARGWKKALLRRKGVHVIEYTSDYSLAVTEGRRQAAEEPLTHFIDDENSRDLFLGYATAGQRLAEQLAHAGIRPCADTPLFVYLPCGVGGGPGGLTLGLKQAFQDYVHCFFAEPVASPCMLLGLMTGRHEKVSVREIGLDNATRADGLAVARPSGFVGRTLAHVISGVLTVADDTLYRLLALTADTQNLFLEPSALAGMPGPFRLLYTDSGREYMKKQGLESVMDRAVHVVWATGGSMVPEDEMNTYYLQGRGLL